jgi:DNA modification methylase
MPIKGTLPVDNLKQSGEADSSQRAINSPPQLSLREIASLTANTHNARKHGRAQVRAIAKSIEAFGFNAPILADRDGKVLAGHGRLEAAALLGLQHVPVILLEHLSEAQARAYMLSDNKLTDRSTWDDHKVAIQLKELSELAIEFDLDTTGFELPEIDLRIQSLDEDDAADRADEFEISAGPAVSVAGDLWYLGRHRLYCGSALDEQAYTALLQGAKAAACFTDPPYNVKIDGHVSGLGRVTHREFAMASGEMSEIEFTRFLTGSLSSICSHTLPGAIIYACMDWRHMTEMLAATRATPCELLNLCVWAKSNGGMGSLYRSRHELVFVFKNGEESHQNNVQLGRFGRNRTNVWNYPGASGFARKGKSAASVLHPTVKPIPMVADAILDSTRRDEIVLDPFLGSGTTLLAAERAGRRCCGTEIDPLYVDTIIARWQSMTGQKAQTPLGETFDIVKSRRRTANHEQD